MDEGENLNLAQRKEMEDRGGRGRSENGGQVKIIVKCIQPLNHIQFMRHTKYYSQL